MIDLYLLYTIIKRLTTPFDKWKAFDVGLIDDKGNFLVRKADRTADQRQSMTMMDVMILNLKKILAKIPGGDTRLGTFAAALYLLKEDRNYDEDGLNDMLIEFHRGDWLTKAEELLEDEGGIPANNIGDGKIADKSDKSKNLFKTNLKRKKDGKPVL